MSNDKLEAASFIGGETWQKALGIFQHRRLKITELLGKENESSFLCEGTFDEIQTEPLKQPTLSRERSESSKISYRLPDQTNVQIHKKDCKKVQMHSPIAWFDFYRLGSQQANSAVAFAAEIQELQKFQRLLQTHGAFWAQALRDVSAEMLKTGGQTKNLMFGSFEFYALDKDLQSRMIAQKVSAVEVISLITEAQDECPCIGYRQCMFCAETFIPTGYAFVELKLGMRACALCAYLASDGEQRWPWSEININVLSEEIDFGSDLQSQLQSAGTLTYGGAPQKDSVSAFRKLRLHALENADYVKGFLTVALRPKEPQVRRVYGYWEQWLQRSSANSSNTNKGTDGHTCNSKGEKIICDYLHEKGIEHRREPAYADFVVGDDQSLVAHFKGDFEVDGVIVEFAGMASDPLYQARLDVKLNHAKKLNLDVMVVGPEDLGDLDAILGSRFKLI